MNNRAELIEKTRTALETNPSTFPSYLAGLAHDIRTPLSAIIGFSDLLAEPRVSRADQRSYSLMIARSSRKLLDLMSNLIDLAKMETGNLEFFYKPVSFKELVEEVKFEMDEMVELYEKENVRIDYELPADPNATLYADKGRLLQIVRILMENSLQYTRQGGITLTVKQNSTNGCIIEVSDTGCGMDSNTVANLFELFPAQQAPVVKKIKSRGMSLCVVKKLCDMLDYDIDVRSEVGIGTKVKLNLRSRNL